MSIFIYMEADETKEPGNIILPIFIVLVLGLILVVSLFVIKSKTSFIPKAGSLNNIAAVSFDNSYIFASPVRARANGESIRITVFLLDEKGLGVFDKQVMLNIANNPIVVKDIQSLSDETGKAIFNINSNVKGTFFIEVVADGKNLAQKVKVVFD